MLTIQDRVSNSLFSEGGNDLHSTVSPPVPPLNGKPWGGWVGVLDGILNPAEALAWAELGNK